jgi:hypothetical protein
VPDDALGDRLADLVGGLGAGPRPWEGWAGTPLFLPPTVEATTLSPEEQQLHDDLFHVERVVHRPRSYLRAEADVAPADRAQRIARRAELHLAGHPEYWARRTIRGIVPRRILAQFLEPDYDLYENRVAIDLLRILRRTLPPRIDDLVEESDKYEARLHGTPRQRQRTATVWAASVSHGDTTVAHGALRTLRDVHRRVRAMGRTPLAARLRSAPAISPPLRATNVLTHDADYRVVGVLWRTWVGRQDAREDAAALAARRRKAALDYADYCFAAILRALAFLHYVPATPDARIERGGALTMTGPPGDATLSRAADGAIGLRFGACDELRLVAVYDHVTGAASPREIGERIAALQAGPRSIVLFPAEHRLRYTPEEGGAEPLPASLIGLLSGIPADRAGGPYLVQATPHDLLTVERLGRLLRREAWGPVLLDGFGAVHAPTVLATQHPLRWASRHGDEVRIARRATAAERHELKRTYDRARRTLQSQGRRSRSEQLRLEVEQQRLEHALDDTDRAAGCPLCRSSRTAPSLAEAGGYVVRCEDCGAGWGVSACPGCGDRAPWLLPKDHRGAPGEPGAIERDAGLDAIVSRCCEKTLWGRQWLDDADTPVLAAGKP